jgi:hypothetical protein
MVNRRKSIPMETQGVHRLTEAATPMASAPAKHTRVSKTPTSATSRSQAEATRKRSLKKQRSML